MVLRMQVAAKRLGLPVFIWPLAIASSNPTNINIEFLNAMPESQKMNYPKLFGYGFAGMKVRINHNASLDANVVNGTLGTILSNVCRHEYFRYRPGAVFTNNLSQNFKDFPDCREFI